MNARSMSPYRPDGQDAARFNVNPYQRFEFIISGIDRTTPELFPALEGDELYCERADYPVLLTLVTGAQGVQQSFVFKTGTTLRAPFKGVWISHPLMGTLALPHLCSFIVSKNGAHYENQLGDGRAPMITATGLVTNTAVLQKTGIYIPPGARYIRTGYMIVTAATITSARGQFIDAQGNVISGASNISQVIAGVTVSYAIGGPYGPVLQCAPIAPAATLFKCSMNDVHIPTRAVELDLSIVGTGLAFDGGMDLVFT